jgi:hypothetical protein
MANDGKQLEALVAFVENVLLPQGYEVKTNEKVYNDEGIQIAELDVEIRGKVGSTAIAWLIECRDRPAEGPAPGSWIEQLVGRRTRFAFNKVTAVSTTGFAAGAIEFALSQGIELREVKALSADEFDWLAIRSICSIEERIILDAADVRIDPSEPEERVAILREIFTNMPLDKSVLRPANGGDPLSLVEAFLGAVREHGGFFDDVIPNGPEKVVEVETRYADNDYFVLDCPPGTVRVATIVFRGKLSKHVTAVPLATTTEYRHQGGDSISQTAVFATQQIRGEKFVLELHRISESGQVALNLRKVQD